MPIWRISRRVALVCISAALILATGAIPVSADSFTDSPTDCSEPCVNILQGAVEANGSTLWATVEVEDSFCPLSHYFFYIDADGDGEPDRALHTFFGPHGDPKTTGGPGVEAVIDYETHQITWTLPMDQLPADAEALHIWFRSLLKRDSDLLPDSSPPGIIFPLGADGSKIAFTSDRGNVGENPGIYVMNTDGSGQTALTDQTSPDFEPAWSPDGNRIAFTSIRDGSREIYVMNADGTDPTRLTNCTSLDFDPDWSPDGNRIAFTSNRDGNREIYVMNADGSGQINLTNHLSRDRMPSWSPGGSRIAFSSDRDGNNEIYVMNADGSGQINLTNHPSSDGSPAWSPDGNRIAFSSDRDGNNEIYVMNADGTDPTRLTNHVYGDSHPTWSPDGSRIAFMSVRDKGEAMLNYEIYVMNADGSGQINLTDHAASDWEPDWSPEISPGG